MDQYYSQQYAGDGMQPQDQSLMQQNHLDVDFDNLDNQALYTNQPQDQTQHESRRSSHSSSAQRNSRQNSRGEQQLQSNMMEFSAMADNNPMTNFQFNPSSTAGPMMMMPGAGLVFHQQNQSLANNAQYNHQQNYAAALLQNQYNLQANAAQMSMTMDMQNNFMHQNIPLQMNFTDPSSGLVGSYSLVPQNTFNPSLMMGGLPQNYADPSQNGMHDRHNSYPNGNASDHGNVARSNSQSHQGNGQTNEALNHDMHQLNSHFNSQMGSPIGSVQVGSQHGTPMSTSMTPQRNQQSSQAGSTARTTASRQSSHAESGSAQGAQGAQAQGQAHLLKHGQMPHQSPSQKQQGGPQQQRQQHHQMQQQAQLPQQFGDTQSQQPQDSGDHSSARDMTNQRSNQSYTSQSAVKQTFRNAYSSTGFDMLTVLMRVATRPKPDINIGAVDLSCAFVVCDANEHDFPIVYCSENFERLTGYTKYEILGRNCRFLQAPDGKVQSGLKRAYTDDDAVLYLKNTITQRKEAQISIINYRKGGQPFMNLLTTIPIPYDTEEIKFFVGFQVDLVEQPNSITDKNPDGTYTINYQRGLSMPRYLFPPAEQRNVISADASQTVPRDEVSTVLSTIGTGESELSKRIWDKVLLENTDDVVCVLSLKGLFLYLSPSCKKMLEYDANELMGTALSSICHPSDIVPVTRELKDTSTSAAVSVVLRIRRKHSGYMWFEGHGALHTEQGKGRKSIVLVGRERPVYTLSKRELAAAGGIGDNEVWTKLSTSGMFLFVSSNVRSVLERSPDELIGTSIQALMRLESKTEFNRVLELARHGKRSCTKHDLMSKRGQVLQAFSTVFPGDAVEGSKPTFVIAQTRLLKYSRPSMNTPMSNTLMLKTESETGNAGQSPALSLANSTSQNGMTPQRFMSSFDAATTRAGQLGLAIGRQDHALASDENLFDELKTTRSTSWQFELRQMEKRNRLLAEELQGLLAARKKRKRRKGTGQVEKDCANCHTRVTPEWRKGPSGKRDLCNSCGLRWAKQQGRISPRTSSQRSQHSAQSDQASASTRPPQQKSALRTDDGDNAAVKDTLAAARQAAHLQEQRNQSDGDDRHVSKHVKMESSSMNNASGSYPTSIEEDDEEDSPGHVP